MSAMRPLHLFHIAYNAETTQNLPAGHRLLDNVNSARNDWREYWPIRNFLLSETLDEEAYYGFLSPRFRDKVGLDHAAIRTVVDSAQDADVITFSPQPDMGAFFLNIFEQEELFQPGFTAASEAFLAEIGLPLSLGGLVMDSRQIVFSNYILARPAFWRAWLEINERLFAICEGAPSPLQSALTSDTNYPGAVQRKVFLMERVASLILTLQAQWRVHAYNTFNCAWSASRLNQFRHEAVLSDALKIAMREQGYPQYREAFSMLRDRLRVPDISPL